MAVKKLSLGALLVNRANDRHGELENETAAIAWLFSERETHMRNLAKDIVEQGGIYEYPLVSPEKSKFIVFDGNRRVTCLKLLEDPRRAPTTELQAYFREQKARWKGAFPKEITCQVEADRDRIDEILFRRHTGSQAGVGQSTWDDRMKATFVARTGKGSGLSVADEIESRLSEANLLPSRRKIPRSTLNRLLSSEPFRQRVGISMKGGRFRFINDQSKSLSTLARIAKDLAEREIVLGDIWDIEGKQSYLDKLEHEGVLPAKASSLASADDATPVAKKKKVTPSVTVKPTVRDTLIPKKQFDLSWPGRLERHHQIWEELQFHLNIRGHRNAISVLMRVLIELAAENYIKQTNVVVHDNDKLAKKLEKVGQHLLAAGKIDEKQLDVLKKFKLGDKLISADTFDLRP